MAGQHLLVVEEKLLHAARPDRPLRHHGFEVTAPSGGRTALEAAANVRPDLIVLDVMMPELDGFEVCRRLRAENNHTPILFLTARDSTEDKVRGLTLGGDDYLEKPFSLEELVARVNAVLRRTGASSSPAHILEIEDLRLNDEAHIVTKSGSHVHLSPTEYKLLRYLLINKGKALSKLQILDHVWEYDFDGDGGVVETYIGYLRRKLDTTEPKLIHTIRGTGYTIRVQP